MAHEITKPIPCNCEKVQPWHGIGRFVCDNRCMPISKWSVETTPQMDNRKVTAPTMTLSERIRSLVDRSKADLVKVVAPDNDASCRRQYRSWTKGQLVVEALRQDGFLDDDDETVIMSKRMDE